MRKIIIVFSALFLCNTAIAQVAGRSGAMPHVIVYKTKASYRDLVPVTLSADKKSIESYPAPDDVKSGTGYATPVQLHKGYFLDRRGIGKNSAFLKLTYEQYANLKTFPSQEELYNMIIDKSPIRELCDCGVRSATKNSEKQLNDLIDKKQLQKKCKTIK